MSDLHVNLQQMNADKLSEEDGLLEYVNDNHLTGNRGLHFVVRDIELEGVLDEDCSSNSE